MTRRLLAMAGVLLLASPIWAQRDSGIYTQPNVPSPKDLDRLNMVMEWKTYLPVENRSDAIASVQLIDAQIFVQTRSNTLVVLRAATGEEEWRVTLPKRYLPVFPLAVNRDLVCVVNGPKLFILDRSNGKGKFTVELPSTVSAGLAADIQQCFIVLSNNRLIAVGLQPEDVQRGSIVRKKPEIPEAPTGLSLNIQSPSELSTTANPSPSLAILPSLRPPFTYIGKDISPSFQILPSLRAPYELNNGNRAPSVALVTKLSNLGLLSDLNSDDKPRILWELQANRRMEETPLMYGSDFLIIAATDRSVFACDKHASGYNRILQEFRGDAKSSAPIGQYGAELYFALADGTVYWVNVESFRHGDVPVIHIKRYLANSAIDRKPVTTDDSVYLAGTQAGLTRLDRKTFEKVWTNLEADRILAVNPNVIYAGDRRGNVIILDRARGLKLATLEASGFGFPVVNEQDDRLYLAASNGLLVCLHDRTFRRPELSKKKEPRSEVVAIKEEPKKEPEPPKKAPDVKKDPEVKKDVEPKKDVDLKKEVDPKKEAMDAKKDVELKKEVDPKKDLDPKKEVEPKAK